MTFSSKPQQGLAKAEEIILGNDTNTKIAANQLPAESERPKYIVVEDWLKLPDRSLRPGVHYCGMTKGSKEHPPVPFEEFICGPMHVVAVTHDDQNNNFGRLLKFKNSLGCGATGPCLWSCLEAQAMN